MNTTFIILIIVQIILIILQYIIQNIDSPPKVIAIAYLNSSIKGSIYFSEHSTTNDVTININLSGLPPNSQLGFHIHEAGDLSDGCTSACAHFNPFKTVHGGKDSAVRHVGDLGNIITDSAGICKMKFRDHLIKLRGYTQNIIGRSIVIHEKKDDLGKGGNEESLKTGNAGKRIGCAVIGYAKKMCK